MSLIGGTALDFSAGTDHGPALLSMPRVKTIARTGRGTERGAKDPPPILPLEDEVAAWEASLPNFTFAVMQGAMTSPLTVEQTSIFDPSADLGARANMTTSAVLARLTRVHCGHQFYNVRGCGEWRAVSSGRWKLVLLRVLVRPDGTHSQGRAVAVPAFLFDTKADPFELDNLIASVQPEPVAAKLQLIDALESWQRKVGDPFPERRPLRRGVFANLHTLSHPKTVALGQYDTVAASGLQLPKGGGGKGLLFTRSLCWKHPAGPTIPPRVSVVDASSGAGRSGNGKGSAEVSCLPGVYLSHAPYGVSSRDWARFLARLAAHPELSQPTDDSNPDWWGTWLRGGPESDERSELVGMAWALAEADSYLQNFREPAQEAIRLKVETALAGVSAKKVNRAVRPRQGRHAPHLTQQKEKRSPKKRMSLNEFRDNFVWSQEETKTSDGASDEETSITKSPALERNHEYELNPPPALSPDEASSDGENDAEFSWLFEELPPEASIYGSSFEEPSRMRRALLDEEDTADLEPAWGSNDGPSRRPVGVVAFDGSPATLFSLGGPGDVLLPEVFKAFAPSSKFILVSGEADPVLRAWAEFGHAMFAASGESPTAWKARIASASGAALLARAFIVNVRAALDAWGRCLAVNGTTPVLCLWALPALDESPRAALPPRGCFAEQQVEKNSMISPAAMREKLRCAAAGAYKFPDADAPHGQEGAIWGHSKPWLGLEDRFMSLWSTHFRPHEQLVSIEAEALVSAHARGAEGNETGTAEMKMRSAFTRLCDFIGIDSSDASIDTMLAADDNQAAFDGNDFSERELAPSWVEISARVPSDIAETWDETLSELRLFVALSGFVSSSSGEKTDAQALAEQQQRGEHDVGKSSSASRGGVLARASRLLAASGHRPVGATGAKLGTKQARRCSHGPC